MRERGGAAMAALALPPMTRSTSPLLLLLLPCCFLCSSSSSCCCCCASALVNCWMFNHALSAVASPCPLSSTPPLSAVSPLSSAVVVVRHCYCPCRPPSTAICHCRCRCPLPLLMPLSTTIADSAHCLHCCSFAVLVYATALCRLRPPSSILVICWPRCLRMKAMMMPALAVIGKGGQQWWLWWRRLSAVAVMGWRLHHPSLSSTFTTILIARSAVCKPNGMCEGTEGQQDMLGVATTAGGTDNRQQST